MNYLVKPLAESLQTAQVGRVQASQAFPDQQVPEIIGESAAMLRVRHQVVLASRSDANVVIMGPTGAGKELIARAIHRMSSDRPRAFVAHNCALTPGEMFDSEFFGHRRGAFTGADRDRAGLLRQADGGILFLDELECLTLANQAKLLRVLDDGEIRPLGSDEPRSVSVRFLAATNRTPRSMFATGDLREDLYYRLRGFQIDLPPLRERSEDIPQLTQHFLRKRGQRLTAAALAALISHGWPGNVRQLRSVLDWACSSVTGVEIDVDDLDLGDLGAPRADNLGELAWPCDLSLQEVERRTIVAVLAANGGSRVLAAKTLGIHRSTLRRKLTELGLADDDTAGNLGRS